MGRKYVNGYSETVATVSVTDTDTAIDVAAAPPDLAAGEYYIATLTDSLTAPTKTEIIKVTGISGTTLTIERGLEGTSAQAWDNTDFIEVRATAESFETIDGAELKQYSDTTATASNAIDRANGAIQTLTMTAAGDVTISISNGESLLLNLIDGDTNAPTWPAITWVNNGGAAPTLTANHWLSLWCVGSAIYGVTVTA